MESKEIVRWQDTEALRRFQMIAPLVADGVDAAKRVELRKEIALKNDVSERTIRRYETAYWSNAFEGLKPVSRISGEVKGPFPGFTKVLDEAILLKREVPSRSVNQIIFILESEKVVQPGQLTRPTLQRYLYRAGFGRKQMKKYSEAQNSSLKRFCKPHRMMLAQADIKYVMKLPIGKNGAKVQCYIAALIDDHSRFILSLRRSGRRQAAMFESFFEMKRTPFTRDVPPESLYEPPFLTDTLGRLSYAADRQLFAVVTGDAGCGKSTLIRKFASTMSPKDYIVMYLSDSKLTPRWFYKGMLDQLGIEARFYRGDRRCGLSYLLWSSSW